MVSFCITKPQLSSAAFITVIRLRPHVISESGPEGGALREGDGAAPSPTVAVAESRMAAEAAAATEAPPSPSPPRSPPAAIPTAMPALWQARYSRGGGGGGREEAEVGMKNS